MLVYHPKLKITSDSMRLILANMNERLIRMKVVDLNIQISPSSVATYSRNGGSIYSSFLLNSSQKATAK